MMAVKVSRPELKTTRDLYSYLSKETRKCISKRFLIINSSNNDARDLNEYKDNTCGAQKSALVNFQKVLLHSHVPSL